MDNIKTNINNESNIESKQNGANKIIVKIVSTILIIAAIISAVFIIINEKRRSLYNELLFEMQNFKNSSIERIDKIFNEMPTQYENIDEYRTQYNEIRKNVNLIYDCEQKGLWGLTEFDTNKVRDSYIQLSNINNLYNEWDLNSYLDGIDISILVFGVKWESVDNSYSFQWTEYEDAFDAKLTSTIPSDKTTGKSYYYTTDIKDDYIIFGYENQDDSSDKFNAFKVYGIICKDSILHLNVYCYKNESKYVFTNV